MRNPSPEHEFSAQPEREALGLSRGVSKPDSVNPDLATVVAGRRRAEYTVTQLFEGLRTGNRTFLGRAITLVESTLPAHQIQAQELVRMCMPHAGQSIRLGITGVPGAGKSTFIEALGTYLTDVHNRRIAVLAVDPSSRRSRGSILGDKTRMTELSVRANVFIRPSPSAGSLGGVAQKTRETVLVCEAAGYDTIFIETVGVGQSEIAVHGMVDFFLLLMLAGAGDDLQGIKRGIMEMAHGMAITKADGGNEIKAGAARSQYQSALHLFPPNPWGWMPRVLTTSALTKQGIPEVWDMVKEFEQLLAKNGWWEHRRMEQLRNWMRESVEEQILSNFYNKESVQKAQAMLEAEVLQGKRSPFDAARVLLGIGSVT